MAAHWPGRAVRPAAGRREWQRHARESHESQYFFAGALFSRCLSVLPPRHRGVASLGGPLPARRGLCIWLVHRHLPAYQGPRPVRPPRGRPPGAGRFRRRGLPDGTGLPALAGQGLPRRPLRGHHFQFGQRAVPGRFRLVRPRRRRRSAGFERVADPGRGDDLAEVIHHGARAFRRRRRDSPAPRPRPSARLGSPAGTFRPPLAGAVQPPRSVRLRLPRRQGKCPPRGAPGPRKTPPRGPGRGARRERLSGAAAVAVTVPRGHRRVGLPRPPAGTDDARPARPLDRRRPIVAGAACDLRSAPPDATITGRSFSPPAPATGNHPMRQTPWLVLLTLVGVFTIGLRPVTAEDVIITLNTPMSPPTWALLERQLLQANTAACQAFFDRYFDERGYLMCVERWGGDDGPDDAIENCTDWPILHALGAPDVVLHMYKKAWEGHLRQYTAAKTKEVPFAREGMYFKEFPVMFDWLHNSEGLTPFNVQGLSNPYDRLFRQRVRRFAGFYLNEDAGAPNYDPTHKIIRSLFNGSR